MSILQTIKRSASTGGTIRLPKSKVPNIDASEYSFAKFAATYFNSGVTGQYSKRPLKKSLLDHDLPLDEIAAQVSLFTFRASYLLYYLKKYLKIYNLKYFKISTFDY